MSNNISAYRFCRSVLLSSSVIWALTLPGCVSGFLGNSPVEAEQAPVAYNAELAYLETLAMQADQLDVQILALLLQEYQSSDRRIDGVDFFTDLIDKRSSDMPDALRLVSLSALGILRAETASSVPLLGRINWVEDTIAMLEQARALGGNEVFFSRLATGLVYAALPDRFEKQEQARIDLDWLVDHKELSPSPGLMRGVYKARAELSGDDDSVSAKSSDADELMTNFSVSPVHGATFFPMSFKEILPDRVYLISGLEFTEYYFILSADRQHLISIDAGTRKDFSQAAYNILRANVADLPPLTTVFVTHAHWDHVGGHEFFRELNPNVKFYGRDNYHEEVEIMEAGPANEFGWFFGEKFSFSALKAYHPDVAITDRQSIEIGGTTFELIPAPGSETPDAMFINMPQDRLLFVGDFIMPFSGAPFIEEGSVEALFESMDLIDSINPERLLHGHQPLTQFFPTPAHTSSIRGHLEWLAQATRSRIQAGQTSGEIHRQNLLPPTLLKDSRSQQFYLVMREQVINRIYDQSVGYWESDLSGLDTLDAKSYGELLSRYLSVDEGKVVTAVEAMYQAGDYHLAERVSRWALAQWPDSQQLAALQRQVALKLRVKYQAYNPFKFFLYSELANAPLGQPVPVEGQ